MVHEKTKGRPPPPRRIPSGFRPRVRVSNTTSILVAFPQSLHRHALAALLRSEQEFDVVGLAATPRETTLGCARLSPHILALDAVMPDLDGVPTIVAVRAVSPQTSILAVADRCVERCPLLALRDRGREHPGGRPCDPPTDCLQVAVARGALGAIRAGAEPEDLFRAVRAVASGTAWYEAGTASAMLARTAAGTTGSHAGALSVRDLEVAALVAEGRCNKEIAQSLAIGVPTVKRHVSRILLQLGLPDRLQLALFFVSHPLSLEPNRQLR